MNRNILIYIVIMFLFSCSRKVVDTHEEDDVIHTSTLSLTDSAVRTTLASESVSAESIFNGCLDFEFEHVLLSEPDSLGRQYPTGIIKGKGHAASTNTTKLESDKESTHTEQNVRDENTATTTKSHHDAQTKVKETSYPLERKIAISFILFILPFILGWLYKKGNWLRHLFRN